MDWQWWQWRIAGTWLSTHFQHLFAGLWLLMAQHFWLIPWLSQHQWSRWWYSNTWTGLRRKWKWSRFNQIKMGFTCICTTYNRKNLQKSLSVIFEFLNYFTAWCNICHHHVSVHQWQAVIVSKWLNINIMQTVPKILATFIGHPSWAPNEVGVG